MSINITEKMLSDRVDYTSMVDVLYGHNSAGGSLHIVTDDDNICDDHLDFCRNEVGKNDDPEWLKHLQYAILLLLRSYNEDSYGREYVHYGFIGGSDD